MTFSILIPAYKKKFLNECIDSILCQSFRDFEVIIVNDASPEDIDEIVKGYNDNRVRYFVNDINEGAANLVNNWNRCLQYASGSYVMCIGDDDLLAPDCLANYANLVSLYPDINVFHSRVGYINESSSIVDLQEERPEQETVLSMIWHFLIKGRRQVLGEWLFRTEKLKEIGGFYVLPCGWDSDNITAFGAAKDFGVVNMRYIGFYYRITDLTVSSQSSYAFEKVNAYCLSERWYSSFLLPEAENDLDIFYRNNLLQQLRKRMSARKIYEIYTDLNCQFFNVFKWLRISDKIAVSKLDIFRTAKNVLKNKFLNL